MTRHEPRRPEQILDIEQAALHLGTSVRHVRRLRSDGRLAYIKVGGLLRFRRSELDEYLRRRTKAGLGDSE